MKRRILRGVRSAALFFGVFLSSATLIAGLMALSADAACISPASEAGTFAYNTTRAVYEVCDGNAWTSMAAATPSGSCTGAGLISYSAGPRFCNGSLFVSMNGSETGAGCSSVAGTFQYNPTLGYMQWCNGTTLRAMRLATAGITYVQQATLNSTTNTTSFNTGAFGGSANVTTGNGIVCSITYLGNTRNLVSVTASGSQALSKAVGPYTLGGGANTYRTEIWYRTNITGSTGTRVNVVLNASTSVMVILCNEYSGLAASQAFDQSAVNSATGATVSAGPVTTTSAKELLFATAETDNATPTVGSGYTLRGAAVNGVIVEDRMVTAISSYSATINSSTSTAVASILFATFRGQ